MRSDPDPDEIVTVFYCQRTMSKTDTSGPESADFFEME